MVSCPLDKRRAASAYTRLEYLLAMGLATVSIALAVVVARHAAAQAEATSAQSSGGTDREHGLLADSQHVNGNDGEDSGTGPDDADPAQAKKIPLPQPADTNAADVYPSVQSDLADGSKPAHTPIPSASARQETKHALTTQEIDAALAAIDAMEWGPDAEKKLNELVAKWSAQDPTAALDYVMGIESRKTRNSLMQTVFSTWMKTDPGSARFWFSKQLSIDPSGLDAVVGLIYRDMPISSIWQLPGNSLKRGALSAFVSDMLSNNDLTQLFQLRDSMSAGADRDLLTDAILRGAGTYQPAEIATWALQFQDAKARQQTLDGIIRTWAADDPQEAAQWVTTLTNPAEKSQEIAKVTQAWARDDAVATGDWLLSMHPPSSTLDPALATYVRAVMKDNPSGAMSWVGTVSDPKQRDSLMIQVGKLWIRSDPDSLMSFLDQSGASTTVRNAIIQSVPKTK